MLQGDHSAILSTFNKLPFVINIFVLSIFEWPLKTGFTVLHKSVEYWKIWFRYCNFLLCRFSQDKIINLKEGYLLYVIINWDQIQVAFTKRNIRHIFLSLYQHHRKNGYEPWHEISNNMVCATSKASDQPAHMRSLIRAFASRLSILWVLSYWLNSTWSF